MKKLNQFFSLAVAIVALGLSRPNANAQPNFGGGNFDPQQMMQQMQQQILESIRDQLAITNDVEWNVIQPRLAKVTQTTMDSMMGQMRGMMGGRGGGPGGPGGGFAGFGQPDPAAEALQKLLDDHAPTAQIKAALAKYRESVKQKKAAVTKAQDELRQVLSGRQEAILTALGALD